MEKFGHAALVEDGDLHAALDKVGRDIRLQIRKTQHAVWLPSP